MIIMSKKFYISDTHFGHYNIIEYSYRPFKTLKEMDSTLIENWNAKVRPNDLVYHLGDFAWKDARKYREQLNGHIILIRGNHDKVPKNCFNEVCYYKEIKDSGYRLILMHYPLITWNHVNSPTCYYLHGHLHINSTYHHKKRINISCELMGYEPKTIKEIL